MLISEFTLDGQNYRVTCQPGEQPKLRNLVEFLNDRLEHMRGYMSDISHHQLIILALLTLADDYLNSDTKIVNDGAVASSLDAVTEYVDQLVTKLENLNKEQPVIEDEG